MFGSRIENLGRIALLALAFGCSDDRSSAKSKEEAKETGSPAADGPESLEDALARRDKKRSEDQREMLSDLARDAEKQEAMKELVTELRKDPDGILSELRGAQNEARVTLVNSRLRGIAIAIAMYRLNHSELPASLSDLLTADPANKGEPYVADRLELIDPWDNEFVYTVTGKTTYRLMSLGADGVEGGKDADADIELAR